VIFKFGRLHIFKEHKNEYIKTVNQKLINNLRTSGLIKKNDDVLDFGCGIGIWDSEKSTSVFFHDLYLYDENIENLEFCKKKYPHYNILNNLNDNLHVNVIFVNSVIQYINTNDLEKLFDKFASILKNDGIVIISDIPKYSRILEYGLTFFSNFNLFKIQTRQLLSKSYRKTHYYLHSFDELIMLSQKKFTHDKNKNLDINSNRYSVLFKKK